MRYDHPNCTVRREACYQTTAGNGAVSARFATFQKKRLHAVHVQAAIAGTTAGHTVIIKDGTTALGTATLGTSAAGTKVKLDNLDRTVESGNVLSATNGTDATGVALVTYEYQVLPDAEQSA